MKGSLQGGEEEEGMRGSGRGPGEGNEKEGMETLDRRVQ